jgi:hypothetical protein
MERPGFARFAAMVLTRRELNRWAKREEAAASGELESKHAPRMV